MFRLIKERRHLTVCGILVLVLIEIVHTSAERHTGNSAEGSKHRRKRQMGDIFLMGYKAQGALKGTTKPSDYFQRIGRNWGEPLRANRFNDAKRSYSDSASDNGGLYVEDVGYDAKQW